MYRSFPFVTLTDQSYYQKMNINTLISISMDPQSISIPQGSDFSLANIPFGVVSLKGASEDKFPATRVGDWIVNLREVEKLGLFNGEYFSKLHSKVFQGVSLNAFMGLTRSHWKEARATLQSLFSNESVLHKDQGLRKKILFAASEAINHLPAQIGDYTDFYSSRSHAFNVGSIIRGPANALQQNWLHIPIGYHGRASSIVVSGTPLRRPRGQIKGKDATLPTFSECKRLDFQIQVGAFIGGHPNDLGKPIKVQQAWQHIFGFVILNDWSFRDFQTWEYVPLGPFTAKNGMSTISPWIVTLQALQGSQVELSAQEPLPLQYLQQKPHISYDIALQLSIRSPKMQKYHPLVTTNFKYMYWSSAQQLAHHAVSGCNMQPGDLLGSGTISGDKKEQFGSLLELTWGGANSLDLGNGQARKFLEDGDSVLIKGIAHSNGQRIGFGDCEGTVLPALPQTEYY